MVQDFIGGIDIGGTGIKGAPVDLATGKLAAERLRIETPHPATPAAVAGVVAEIVRHFAGHDRFGCTLPSVVRDGVALTAAPEAPGAVEPLGCPGCPPRLRPVGEAGGSRFKPMGSHDGGLEELVELS